MTVRLRAAGGSLAFYTAFTSFDLPPAPNPHRIRIERLCPADAATADRLQTRAGR